jgi:hypothetical protein
MTLKRYLTIMSLMSFLCWLIWFYLLWLIDPENTNFIGFFLFYFSLFLSLIGTSAIIGFLIKFVLLKKDLAFRIVKETFRQSFLFSLLIIVSLILLSFSLFTWLNLFFLIIALSILEYLLIS